MLSASKNRGEKKDRGEVPLPGGKEKNGTCISLKTRSQGVWEKKKKERSRIKGTGITYSGIGRRGGFGSFALLKKGEEKKEPGRSIFRTVEGKAVLELA